MILIKGNGKRYQRNFDIKISQTISSVTVLLYIKTNLVYNIIKTYSALYICTVLKNRNTHDVSGIFCRSLDLTFLVHFSTLPQKENSLLGKIS